MFKMYHSDIIIIGAGPAGLSAAVRARRVRTYNLLTSSVTIISNTSPGGLADWTKVRMTGDGWSYEKGEVIEKLMKDVDDYCIPVIEERVLKVEDSGELFTVITDKGEYTSLAVVLATGMRMTWNEKEYFKKDLFGTLKGYRFMEDHFAELCHREEGKSIVFVGTEELDKTLEFFETINQGRMDVKTVVDRGDNIRGYEDDITVVTDEGDVSGDHVLIDFESYMLSTYSGNVVDCEKNDSKFITADVRCRVKDGLFAAGDITGPPFSLAKAIGTGTTAGLESYRYAYHKKFNKEAPVFAFYPIHKKGSATYFEIPELKGGYRPKLLAGYKIDNGKIVFRECELEENAFNLRLLELCDGRHTLKQIRDELGDVDDHIRRLIHGKDLTLEV
ncbi:MAG: NAD(P)/FAD-dependent oxidoreductase [Thermoplasmata archaeon]